jgi:hypothetical protein
MQQEMEESLEDLWDLHLLSKQGQEQKLPYFP